MANGWPIFRIEQTKLSIVFIVLLFVDLAVCFYYFITKIGGPQIRFQVTTRAIQEPMSQ